jgi:hypothetical protein
MTSFFQTVLSGNIPNTPRHKSIMTRKQLFWFIISLTCITSASAVENFEDIYWEAHIAYQLEDYSRAIALYKSLIDKGYENPDAVYNLACCYSLAGQPDPAFEQLNLLCSNEVMEFDSFLEDEDFKPLYKDSRWPEIVEKCRAAEQKYIARSNAELYQLYLDCKAQPELAQEASKRILKLSSSRQLKSSNDYFHAASIVAMLDSDPASLKLAQKLAEKADRLEPKHPYAKGLRAVAIDLFLWANNLPQIYGSQMKQDKNKKWTYEPFDPKALSDEQRAADRFLSLDTLRKRIQLLNEKGIE